MRLFRLMFAASALVLLSSPLFADSTYTYTGNVFTSVSGDYTTSDSITGYLTFDTLLAPSLTDDVLSPTAFSFSDGLQTIDSTDLGAGLSLILSTDSNGNIVDWFVFETSGTGYIALFGGPEYSDEDAASVYSSGSYASNFDPGTFSSPTPEPSSIALVATGLVTAAATLRRRITSR